jgi:hypothetical protein
MKYYKLTNQKLQTYDGFQWQVGKWIETSGIGDLCTAGWLHCYNHPLLAVLLNPMHANISNPKLFKVEVRGKEKIDKGLKFGFSKMRLVKEIELPIITQIQQVAFTILCAKKVYKDKKWNRWADNWLSEKDRSKNAADVTADAAYVAYVAADAAAYVVAAYVAADAADVAYVAADTAADVVDVAADAADVAADAADVAAVAANVAANVAACVKLDLIKLAKKAVKY